MINKASESYPFKQSLPPQVSIPNATDQKVADVRQRNPINKQQNSEKRLGSAPKEYLASSNQKQLWMHQQFNPGSSTYNLHQLMHFKKGLDTNIYRLSTEEIIRRHEAARTTFREEGGVVWQCIQDEILLETGTIDATGLSLEQITEKALQLSMRPYDLQKGPLLRLYFFVSRSSDEVLVLNGRHHIVWDAWSGGAFISELGAIYTAFKNNQPSPLPPVKRQYHELAKWQKPFTESEKGKEQMAYWINSLENTHPIEMPMAKKKPHQREFTGDRFNLDIESDFIQALNAQAAIHNVSMHVYTLTAYLITLFHYTNSEDLTVRIPTPGRLRAINERDRVDFSENIGYFVNPTVFRTRINSKQKIDNFIAQVNSKTIQNRNNQDYPLMDLLGKHYFKIPEIGFNFVKPRPGEKFNPFSVDSNAPIIVGDLNYTLVSIPMQTDLLDVNFSIISADTIMRVGVSFRSDVMTLKDAERFANHFKQVLNQMVKNPQLTVGDVCLLTEAEKQKLLIENNNTRKSNPANQTIFDKIITNSDVDYNETIVSLKLSDQPRFALVMLVEKSI